MISTKPGICLLLNQHCFLQTINNKFSQSIYNVFKTINEAFCRLALSYYYFELGDIKF